MPGVLANVRQGSAFYVNIATVATTDALDATGTTAANTHLGSGAAGTVLLRDMGKTVRVAAQASTNHVTNAPVSMILRKVQLVKNSSTMSATTTAPLSSFVAVNDGVGGEVANGFDTFFIQLCPVNSKWARLSL